MKKIFLTVLILFSNTSEASLNADSAQLLLFGSCETAPATTTSIATCAVNTYLAMLAVNKVYNLIKDLVVLLKAKILIKKITKDLEDLAKIKADTKLQDLLKSEDFQKTDLWLSLEILKSLDPLIKAEIEKIKPEFSIEDTIKSFKTMLESLVEKIKDPIKTIKEIPGAVVELGKSFILEFKSLIDKDQKITDRFVLSTDKAAKLKKLFGALKINGNPEDPEIKTLNSSVAAFLAKITENKIKLTDMQEFLKEFNKNLNVVLKKDNLLKLVTSLTDSKTIKLQETLDELLVSVKAELSEQGIVLEEEEEQDLRSSFSSESSASGRSSVSSDTSKTSALSTSDLEDKSYFEKYNGILAKLKNDPLYEIMLSNNVVLKTSLDLLMNNYIAQNITNFKNGKEDKLIFLEDKAKEVFDNIYTPEMQLRLLLDSNSENTLADILKSKAFKEVIQKYLAENKLSKDFFRVSIMVGGRAFRIYDEFKKYPFLYASVEKNSAFKDAKKDSRNKAKTLAKTQEPAKIDDRLAKIKAAAAEQQAKIKAAADKAAAEKVKQETAAKLLQEAVKRKLEQAAAQKELQRRQQAAEAQRLEAQRLEAARERIEAQRRVTEAFEGAR